MARRNLSLGPGTVIGGRRNLSLGPGPVIGDGVSSGGEGEPISGAWHGDRCDR